MVFNGLPAMVSGFTVVIDAGHGGHDVGCIGGKVYEKEVALAISLRLGAMIEAQLPDVKVVYTRKTDVFLELHERAEIANNAKADLFICIHCNSACRFDKAKRKEVCNEVIHGAETYIMGLHVSEANLEVAKRENNVITLEKDYGKQYEGFDPGSPQADIIFSLYQNTYLDQSLSLASMIQNQLGAKGRTSRGVKQAGFWVLYKTAMPSVLIETGFLSHPAEQQFLDSEDGQKTIASGIFKAFRQYKRSIDHGSVAEPEVEEDTEQANTPSASKQIEPAASTTSGEKKSSAIDSDDSKGIWYSVQLLTSDKKLAQDSPRFNGVAGIREEKSGAAFKYCFGQTTSFNEAISFQSKMRSSGFKDAFVVAYRDKERISVQEARQIIQKSNSK